MSIEQAEKESAAVAKAPDLRIKLSDIEARIHFRHDTPADWAVTGTADDRFASTALQKLSLCFLVLDNGYVVVGKSAPLSPENYNSNYGKKLAYEDAIRQLWPLMAFGRLDSERERERNQL